MKIMSFNKSLKLILVILLVSLLWSCKSANPDVDLTVPEDIPLEEFVIGRWLYEGEVYYENLGYRQVHWDYWFEDGNIFKVYTGDGTTCKYEFISTDEIAIDCSPRSLELWTIKVERDGQSLLVYRSDSEVLRFERIDPNETHRDG